MADSPYVTGNYATFLQDVTGKTSTTIKLFSDLFGTIADIAGAAGAVSTIVGFVSSALNTTDEVEQAMEEILDAIQTDFKQLDNDLGANQILERNTRLNDILSTPRAHLQALPASLQANPPLSSGERIAQITDCISAIDALDGAAIPDLVWNRDFDWMTYWTDEGLYVMNTWGQEANDAGVLTWQQSSSMDIGYGPQPPPKNPDGITVFNYSYSLPQYLLAATIFCAVGGALDPAFATNFGDVIKKIISTLQARHDLINQTGFVTLEPTSWSSDLLDLSWRGTKGFMVGPAPEGVPNAATVYFAVVERFSGASAMQPSYSLTMDSANPQANTGDATERKMHMHVLRLRKQLYAFVGLPSVVSCISQLQQILGEPPAGGVGLQDWSVRRDIIPGMGFAAPTPAGFSLGALARFMRDIPPQGGEVSEGVSLRGLLS